MTDFIDTTTKTDQEIDAECLAELQQRDAEFNATVVTKVRGKPVTIGELRKAFFELVANRDDWKMPIDCTLQLTADQVALIRKAVVFFTGGPAKFTKQVHGGNVYYRVRARGYYNTMCD
jgi:hypothetical protein